MRRAAVALAAALVGTLAIAVPPAYAAPSLELSAGCLPAGETRLVRFYVRDQTEPTQVVVTGSSDVQTGTLPSSDSSSYSGNAEVRPGGGTITFAVQPKGGGASTATATVATSGCPTVSSTDECIPAGTITDIPVNGEGFPGGEIALYFDRFGASAIQGTTSGPSFNVLLRVVPRDPGTYFLTASPSSSTSKTVSTTVKACAKAPATTAPPAPAPTTPAPTVVVIPPAPNGPRTTQPPIQVPSAPAAPIPVARTATMSLDPVLGPPGATTRVSASGLPAGAVLNLRWVPGNGLFTVRVGADGRFQTDALVMRRDMTGPRVLEVVGAIPAVRANYLVVRETGGWDDAVFNP